MATTALQSKRKIIDLSEDTFRSLSIMAANKGTNLKNLIEGLLEKAAEEYDENKQYAWLVENVSEGKEMVGEQEKKEFEPSARLQRNYRGRPWITYGVP